ncbi:hypothetical protein Spla01_00857 [Streptomyces platensis]|uniref:Beta-ketoacyl synthase-like N-terminal domain-containing protein n=1 Tax=Streptomyces platensis TaxID=58346 RepID=A0ABX3Y1X7_STRPT|nr:beta-ketoacyl synthase N-terminal-like domain-containing protein [Streptomyces platensis]OSY46310.1 hypothetical protein BG653_02278 [Streptomyces platensis]
MRPHNGAGIAATAVRSAPHEVPRIPDDPAGFPRIPLAVQDTLGPELTRAAEAALADAGVTRAEAAPMGCVTASHHATAVTAQYIAAVLDGAGPRWLAPQCFLHYSPHALTGRLCIDLGLDGTALTLTGPASGVDALGYAAMMVESGRCSSVLVAAAHWPTPPPAGPDRATRLTVAVAVVTPDGDRARLTGWQPGGGHPAVRPATDPDTAALRTAELPDVTAPLRSLMSWHDGPDRAGMQLTAAGSRLTVLPGSRG